MTEVGGADCARPRWPTSSASTARLLRTVANYNVAGPPGLGFIKTTQLTPGRGSVARARAARTAETFSDRRTRPIPNTPMLSAELGRLPHFLAFRCCSEGEPIGVITIYRAGGRAIHRKADRAW